MATQVGISFSDLPDVNEAAFAASTAVKNQINATQTNCVLVFTSVHYARPEALAVINTILKPQRLVGCSSAGLILPDSVAHRGLLVIGINSNDIHFGAGSITNISLADVRASGFELARKMSADFKFTQRNAGIVFTDGLFKNNSPLVRGVQEVMGLGFPIIGAVSSDDFKFKQTFQFSGNQLMSNAAVGLIMGGSMAVGLGCKHGWKPLGKPRVITNADGHIIRTIDHKPAVHIYEDFLGKEIENLKKGFLHSHTILYPLGIYLEAERQYLLRNVVDILVDGSIVCQGEVAGGDEVHLMIGNKDSCRTAALDAAQQVKSTLAGKVPKFIFIIESMSRYKILGRHAFSEIQSIKDVLGTTVPICGMYAYGEIAPFGSLGTAQNTHLHNESMLILAIA